MATTTVATASSSRSRSHTLRDPAPSASSSARKKPLMEVYIEIPHSPLWASVRKGTQSKKAAPPKNGTIDKYFSPASSTPKPRDAPARPSLLKRPLNDKPINCVPVLVPYIDLTHSPKKRKTADRDNSSEEDRGKKVAKKSRTDGKSATGKVDENGKAKKKAALTASENQPKAPVKRVKRIVEPTWTALEGFDDREEVESRIQLREFLVRFRPIIRLAKMHIEVLDEFGSFSKETAKAVVVALLDLIAVDAEGKEKDALKAALREINNSNADPYKMWTCLQALLATTFSVDMTTPHSSPDGRKTRNAARVNRAEQLIDCLLALVDITVQGESVKLELAEGEKEQKEKGRNWTKTVKEETDRWVEVKAKLTFEKPGKTGKDSSKAEVEKERAYKAKYASANKEHKSTLQALNSEYFLSNSASISRFQPLGRDVNGRIYYVLSPYEDGRIPTDAVRDSLSKWSWFVAVWGRRPPSSTSNGSAKPGSSASDASPDDESDDGDENWHAFSSPDEIRKLSKWVDHVAAEGILVSKQHPSPGAAARSDGLPPTTGKEISQLCEGLNTFADYLEWRCGDEQEIVKQEQGKVGKEGIGKGKGEAVPTKRFYGN